MSTPTDATDNAVTLPTSKSTIVQVETLSATIADNDPIAAANMVAMGRVNQQKLLPTAVKGRNVALIQEFNYVDFKYVLVPGGASATFSTTTINSQGQLLENFPAYQIFIGTDPTTLISAGNRMPEVVSSSLHPYYTKESLYDVSGNAVTATGNRKTVHTLQVRNDTGGSLWIGAQIYTKFIVNNSNSASSGAGRIFTTSPTGGFGGGH